MGRRHEILVIDDEPIVGDRLEAILRRDGHSVTPHSDPAEALRTLESRPFDIVVCDIRMGEIDGLQVLDRVLKDAPRTRVIMITGYATLELARASLTRGAFDFIVKPFKIGQLRKSIAKAIDALARDSNFGDES